MVQIGEIAASLTSPLDHLIACHRRIEQRLETLERASAEMAQRPAEALTAIESAVRFMETNGARHTEDEERSLFPRLRPLLSTEELAFVAQLANEHERAELLFGDLKAAAVSLPAAVGDFTRLAIELRSVYRDHIEAEESTLIDLARRCLSAADLALIGGEMAMRRRKRAC